MEKRDGKGYTIADIEALPDGERAELIDGEMFMMATPMTVHQRILVRLILNIGSYIEKNKGNCELLPAPFGVFIKKDDRNYVEPDRETVTIYEADRWDIPSCHSFSERIQTGIYKDLYLDFTEFAKS